MMSAFAMMETSTSAFPFTATSIALLGLGIRREMLNVGAGAVDVDHFGKTPLGRNSEVVGVLNHAKIRVVVQVVELTDVDVQLGQLLHQQIVRLGAAVRVFDGELDRISTSHHETQYFLPIRTDHRPRERVRAAGPFALGVLRLLTAHDGCEATRC